MTKDKQSVSAIYQTSLLDSSFTVTFTGHDLGGNETIEDFEFIVAQDVSNTEEFIPAFGGS